MPTVLAKLSSSQLTDNNKDQIDKYQCPKCNYVLRDAVQTSCGHWLCSDCAEELFDKESTPFCPRTDCGEELTNEEGRPFFPDRFVRKEIIRFNVTCRNRKFGCDWTGTIGELFSEHLNKCTHEKIECTHCNIAFTPLEYEQHKSNCSKAPVECPLKEYGCVHNDKMTKDECVEHMSSPQGIYQHFSIIATFLSSILPSSTVQSDGPRREEEVVVKDGAGSDPRIQSDGSPTNSLNAATRNMPMKPQIIGDLSSSFGGAIRGSSAVLPVEFSQIRQSVNLVMSKFTDLQTQVTSKDNTINMLQDKLKQVELNQQSKLTENEDRDFRLSLMENCNYDGTMIWKIPQFSQYMDDARTGKYTSIFSLPFYSNRYGYKMCLRLYILGDGIGNGSHMSLFFVVMKGEFDNILQWPFTHKVTFKLINQCGGRDIIDNFQPDPLSSSFQKPKSDMNVASGCPRFVSLTELMQGGYVVDDTVFIKVKVDTSTMRHSITSIYIIWKHFTSILI